MTRRIHRHLSAVLTALAVALGGLVLVAAPVHAVSVVLTGEVTYEGGGKAPAPSVALYAVSTGDFVVSATTSLSTYTFDGIAPGTYELYATSQVTGTKYEYDQVVTVPPTNSTKDVVVQRTGTCTSTTSGRPNVGQTLTAGDSIAPPDAYAPFRQTWYRYAMSSTGPTTFITVGTGSSYTLTDADLGYRIARSARYRTTSGRLSECKRIADPSAPIVGGRLAAPATSAAVSGKARVGKTLTAQLGALTPGTTASYQWYRVAKRKTKHHRTVITPIGGATGPTYKVKKKDRGTKLFFQATLGGGGYTPTVVSSTPSKVKS